jgi:carbamoyl-phosphate synthase large subunit
MEKKTVIVTGIGGNVGQGILRNLIASGFPLTLIGTNITALSAGNHWVDGFHIVPYGDDPAYLPRIIDIIRAENADLIIPSTDSEAYELSRVAGRLGCNLATSPAPATETYLDKWLSHVAHKEHGIPFADTVLPSAYRGDYARAIAKPRKGRGSKGILRDVQDVSGLNDTEYVVQEQIAGKEITTAVYCSYISGVLKGTITMERSLENGATTYTKVTRLHDKMMEGMARQMIDVFGLRGSFNIQSIVKPDGEIVPFEVNCRISGTNSIRQGFGFKDVIYTAQELLYGIEPQSPEITEGVAYRYLADVIYATGPDADSLLGNRTDTHIEF